MVMVSFRELDSLETPRAGRGVCGSPHKNDCIGLFLGLGCVGLLSLGVYLSGDVHCELEVCLI